MDNQSQARLARLANDGDRSAAQEYLVSELDMLAGVARRIAYSAGSSVRPCIDPDDLLSEAITQMLHRWSEGTGPTDNITGYLVTSMRNRVIDERRSPRSRLRALETVDEPVSDADAGSIRAIELQSEYELVRRALGSLPDVQRTVLVEIVAGGVKPAALAERMGRSAASVYNLTDRAKKALRVSLLREHLTEGTPESCRAQQQMPKAVSNDIDDMTMESAGMPHMRGCEHCRRSWKRFATITSALGVSTLLVLSDLFAAPVAPAAAAAAGADGAVQPPAGLAAKLTASVAGRIALAAAGVAVLAVGGAVVAHSIGGGASQSAIQAQSESAADQAAASATGTSDPDAAPAPDPTPDAGFDVSSVPVGEGVSQIDFAFSVADRSWSGTELQLDLHGASVVATPAGFECSGGGADVSCASTADGIGSGSFTVTADDADASFELALTAVSGETRINATAVSALAAVPDDATTADGDAS